MLLTNGEISLSAKNWSLRSIELDQLSNANVIIVCIIPRNRSCWVVLQWAMGFGLNWIELGWVGFA